MPPGGRGFLEAGGAHQAEAMIAGLSAVSAKAARWARVLAARAAEMAAERRPEIERQAREMAAAAGARTGRIVAQAAVMTEAGTLRARGAIADRDTLRTLVIQHRRRIAAAAGSLVLLLVLAVLIGNFAASGAARRRVESALNSYHLRAILHYRTMSASVFGTVTLQGVSINPDGTMQLTADAVRIERLDAEGGIVRSLRVSLEGLALPVLQVARHGDTPPARVLAGLGYLAPKCDMMIDVRFDDAEQVSALQTTGVVRALGSWDVSASFGGMTARTVQDVVAAIDTMNDSHSRRYGGGLGFTAEKQEAAAQALTAAASKLTLRDASVELGDAPLIKRMQTIPATEVPVADSGEKSSIVPRSVSAALRDTMAGEDADAAEVVLQRWLSEGGRIVLRTTPAAPLPLFHIGSFDEMPVPAWTSENFLTSLNPRITD